MDRDDDAVEVPLPQGLAAPGQARRDVRAVLLRWRLPALVDTVVLAVSELVANAVRHGKPPVGLVLRRRDASVQVDVRDGSPDPPPVAGAGGGAPDAESGRGLAIVAELADEVAYERVPRDGKVVQATFREPDGGDAAGPRDA